MPSLLELSLGLLLPALICGLVLLAAQRGNESVRFAASGLAFSVAWFVAYLAWAGWPAWPSHDRTPGARDWLAWLVLAYGISRLLVLSGVPANALARLSRPIFSVAVPGFLLHVLAQRNGSWTPSLVVAVATLCAWTVADRWIPRVEGPRAPLALLVTATGVSLASWFCHSALIGSLAGALATCLGAALVLTLIVPTFRLRSSASGAIVLVLAGTIVNVGFFAFPTLPVWSALLLCGSLLAPALLDLRGQNKADAHGSWKDAALATGLAFVPAALAVWIAWTPGVEEY
jgi:hypothetical protein